MADEKVRAMKGGPRTRGPKPHVDNPGKLLKRLVDLIFHYYGIPMVIVLVCIAVSVLSITQGTLFTQTLIDSYIMPMLKSGSQDFSGLARAITRVAVFYAVGVVATFVYQRIMVFVSQGMLRRIRDDMFDHMESLPIRYFDQNAHGDIMSTYTNDTDTLRQMISQSIPQLFNSILNVGAIVISMLILNVPLTFIALAMVAFMTFLSGKFAGISGRYFVSQQRDLAAVNGNIEEMISGQKVVKVFCHEEEAIEQFNRLNDALYHSADRANAFSNILGPINAQLNNVGYVISAVIGGVMALNGFWGFTLGGLASFLAFNRGLSQPIQQISQQMNSIVMALAGFERICRLLDEKPEDDEGTITLVCTREENGRLVESDSRTDQWAWMRHGVTGPEGELVPLRGHVVFEHVDFGYDPRKTVLHDVNLYAEPGQKIAFVGSTGAGKTTITNLINRFYDIQSGTITYDGLDIKSIRKFDLRRSLGIVLQDTHLFTGTVRENIRYGRLDASDEDVIQAAKLANADGFIRRLPDGYDTMLKGDGANLSQGQRQLLAIARAAIADPPVLILDEATSSIDTRTEKIGQNGMDHLMSGRTTFVIAHRLSTVRNSDCIMVLEQGRIIERGSHDDLIAQKGRYYQLYTGNLAES